MGKCVLGENGLSAQGCWRCRVFWESVSSGTGFSGKAKDLDPSLCEEESGCIQSWTVSTASHYADPAAQTSYQGIDAAV